MGNLALSFQSLEFWPYPSKHWNFDLILPNIVILALSILNIANLAVILLKIGVLILSLKTLEFLCYLCKHWNSAPIPVYFGILAVFFERLWFLFPFPNIRILVSFFIYIKFGFLALILADTGINPTFQTLQFWSHFFNIGLSILSFQTLEFWSYPSKSRNSGPVLPKLVILALSF